LTDKLSDYSERRKL